VLVEEFLPGREFTVGVLGTGREARVLGTMEIAMRDAAGPAIYTHETKERCEALVTYSAPPRDPLRRQVEDLARESDRVLECRDAARVDIRLDRGGRPAFLEVNPLPGLHPTHSDLPMIATQEGMAYCDLIGEIIASACRRLGVRHEA
jgi:D-alanine-D-alanine ligase